MGNMKANMGAETKTKTRSIRGKESLFLRMWWHRGSKKWVTRLAYAGGGERDLRGKSNLCHRKTGQKNQSRVAWPLNTADRVYIGRTWRGKGFDNKGTVQTSARNGGLFTVRAERKARAKDGPVKSQG